MSGIEPSGLREVAVIRALPGLGDCLCLVPALRRVRAGAPRARVTVVGHPAGRWMTDRYPHLIDGWIDLPHWPSIIECAGTRAETAALLRMRRTRSAGVDLALQLHGSGGPINWLGVALGARTVAVHTTADRLGPWSHARLWPDRGHEADRLTDLVGELGFPATDRELRFPVRPSDRREARSACGVDAADAAGDGVVVVHPGASRRDRRWEAESFAAVAAAAARRSQVLVTGGRDEHALAATVAAAVGAPCAVRPVTGLSIGGLAALLEQAAVVVANDTGVAHLSVAVGTPTVVVGTTSDLDRWGPRDRNRHRVVQTSGRSSDVRRVIDAMRAAMGDANTLRSAGYEHGDLRLAGDRVGD